MELRRILPKAAWIPGATTPSARGADSAGAGRTSTCSSRVAFQFLDHHFGSGQRLPGAWCSAEMRARTARSTVVIDELAASAIGLLLSQPAGSNCQGSGTPSARNSEATPLRVRVESCGSGHQSDNANRSPSSTAANSRGLRRPTRSVRKDLSIVITCDTFTTEGFDNPAPLLGS